MSVRSSRWTLATLVVGALVAAVPAAASAQIVNVQGSLAKEPPPGWSGQVGGGLDWQTGTTDVVTVSGAGSLLWRHGRWLALALARGEYREGRGVKLSQRSFEHLRLRRDLGARLLWEGFVQHEYDAFRRLSVRAVAGSGPAVRVMASGRLRLTAGLAYLLEYERFSIKPGVADSGLSRVHHRASTYLTGSLDLDGDVTATQTVYVQPRLDAPDDVLLLSETALTSQLTRRLSLVQSFVLAYDATPPETIADLSTALKLTFAVKF